MSNEDDATAPTSNYTFLFPLLTIDVTIGEYIRNIVEDSAFVDLFFEEYFINHETIIVRYGNNIESTFYIHESEETLASTDEPRIALMNAIIDDMATCSKSNMSTMDFTSTLMTMQDGPMQHMAIENIVEDNPIFSNFYSIYYDRMRNAILRLVKLPVAEDGGERNNNIEDDEECLSAPLWTEDANRNATSSSSASKDVPVETSKKGTTPSIEKEKDSDEMKSVKKKNAQKTSATAVANASALKSAENPPRKTCAGLKQLTRKSTNSVANVTETSSKKKASMKLLTPKPRNPTAATDAKDKIAHENENRKSLLYNTENNRPMTIDPTITQPTPDSMVPASTEKNDSADKT